MKRNIFVSVLICFFAINVLAAKSEVVAKVGSKVITLDEFSLSYQRVLGTTSNPPDKKTFLRDLIRLEMALQEAEKKKASNDPLIKQRVRHALYTGFLEKEIGTKIAGIRVSEKEIRQHYAKNPDLKVRHILIPLQFGANKSQVKEAYKKAKSARAKLKKGKVSFVNVAKEYSVGESANSENGKIVWINRVDVPKEFYQAARRLKKMGVSPIVRTPLGFHIIQSLGKGTLKGANREAVKAAVFEKKRVKIYDSYFGKLGKKYSVKVFEKSIR